MRAPAGSVVVAGRIIARLGGITWKFRRAEGTGREAADGRLLPAVYALWHEHLLPLSVLHARQGAVVLVSRHRDGEVLARVLHRLGYTAVRGSTTRGGASGLRALIAAGRSGRPVGLTPDGPRGPRRRCQPGIVQAASAIGVPLVPVGAAATAGWRLRSWDRFLVPRPGATIFVSYGAPVSLPRPGALGDLEPWTRRIERAIDREIGRCEAYATPD
ncbi:MAG: lysophospholipid acyltransferase family protein [Gemmatimonadota bacterium]